MPVFEAAEKLSKAEKVFGYELEFKEFLKNAAKYDFSPSPQISKTTT